MRKREREREFLERERMCKRAPTDGLKVISFDLSNQSSMIWLGRSVVGTCNCEGDSRCIQEEAKAVGLDICALSVGFAYCLLSFRSCY